MRTLCILCCAALALTGCVTSPVEAETGRAGSPAPVRTAAGKSGLGIRIQKAPSSKKVALSLALEPHVADVETTWEWTFRDREGTEFNRSGVRYESVVEAAPEGFVFSRRNVRHGADGVWGLEAMVAALAEGVRVVVTSEGEVVEVQDVDGYLERVDLWLDNDPRFEALEEAREALREQLAAHASPDHLRLELTTEWLLLMPAWVHHPFELGRRYEAGEPTFTYAALERTPCNEGDSNPDCVVLEMKPARGDAMRALSQVVLQRLGVPEGPIMAEEEDTIRLVVRVPDLRPYRLERKRRSQILGRGEGGFEKFGVVETRTTIWSYVD